MARRTKKAPLTLLQDAAGTRWSATELLGWLNEGQRAIVVERPDSVLKNSAK